jgi:hypothetical protein
MSSRYPLIPTRKTYSGKAACCALMHSEKHAHRNCSSRRERIWDSMHLCRTFRQNRQISEQTSQGRRDELNVFGEARGA